MMAKIVRTNKKRYTAAGFLQSAKNIATNCNAIWYKQSGGHAT